ncbi:glycosyltransferase [Rhodoplanes roseus]|uniref:glycosyltransferase n=1 Tax=Rhodoplanes roseus TaxID=29409 RepID=UPI001FE03514|nr:glycosyltransferase [Rhodoplanes roseus]
MSSDAARSQRPLVIVSVATGYGGAERNIEILLPHVPAGRTVVVFACNPYHLERLHRIDRPGLEIHAVDAAHDSFVRDAGRLLMQRCLALRPSAILGNTLDSLRILVHAARRLPGLDARCFVFVHDFLWRDYEPLLASLPRATLLVPDRSVLEKPDYVGRFVRPHGALRALVVPNPVDVPGATPEAAPGAGFLHLATVNGFKGHVHLARAAGRLRKSRPEIAIASYGHRPSPELYREIVRQAEEVGATGTLTLHDHVADPTPLLAKCRAVLVTSVSEHGGPETFGRSIIEAWAHGRPVIAFAAGAPGRMIRHEVDGLLVDEKDVQGLADAIARLQQDPGLARRLGRAGRERAMREFSSQIVAPMLLAVLDGGWLRRGPPAAGRPPSPGRARVLFDVSLSLAGGWRTPVGMSRVESDVAAELARHPEADLHLVCRGAADGGFRRLTPFELEFLANRDDGRGVLAARELAAWCPPPPWPESTIATQVARFGALHRLAGSSVLSAARLRRALRRRRSPTIHRSPADVAPPLQVGSGDVLVSVTNPWDDVPARVFQALRDRGARVVLVVHDLMVWETPHWTAGRDPRDYSDNMLSVIAAADRLVAVSRATAAGVERAMASIGRQVPPMAVARSAGLQPNAAPYGAAPAGFEGGRPFVVYCSTIEVRKNHIMLLHLWERLRGVLPADRLPVLVFVGRWGWCVDTVRLTIERNWRLAPHLRILEDVPDETLLWLYRHARFCVFPSFTEGFGLPVAESLAAGTPVVVSDHPALIEASEGLMPAIDPSDLPAWHREIEALCLDDARLAALQQRATQYRGAAPDELPRAVARAAGLVETRCADAVPV